jgi:hypothetical protein
MLSHEKSVDVTWMVILRRFEFAHQETRNDFRLVHEDKDFLKYENSYILRVLCLTTIIFQFSVFHSLSAKSVV